jgi:transcriptional regulator with XRE-family HTH domain/Zn-dependent peptidase ImmA (M78 family)
MLKEADIVKLIFGLKIQHLRQEKSLSYQQLSDMTSLAISYLHGIEKGKKYPKADKILALAQALDTDYDYLVSLEPTKKLRPIVALLRSDFLKIFPLETFGISTTKLIELLLQAPEKVNAFISTVLKITRNFNMQGEDFYKAALRSYQDLHDNYFPDIETATQRFRKTHHLDQEGVLSIAALEGLLAAVYNIKVDRIYLSSNKDLKHLRSVYHPKAKILYLGSNLNAAHERFLLAKELGFQTLAPEERPYETRMLEIESFEKLLANFHASYFAVALIIPYAVIAAHLDEMREWRNWEGEKMLSWLDLHGVTSEMLLQRFANILPHYCGVKQLFFMRFYTGYDMQKFIVTKEMHLSQLHDPHANQRDEHYCRRWIGIGLIRRLKAEQGVGKADGPIIGAQISRYWDTPNAYFCVCMAKPTRDNPDNSSSVMIGLLVNDQLRDTFPFLADPSIITKDVHTTCERCPILDCGARAVPPVFLQRQLRKKAINKALKAMQQD